MYKLISSIELLDGTMIPLHITDTFATLDEATEYGLKLDTHFEVQKDGVQVLRWEKGRAAA